MAQNKDLIVSILSICVGVLLLLGYNSTTSRGQNHHLEKQEGFDVVYHSISSILRTTFTSVFTSNDTVYVGDSVGSVAIWSFDQKKSKLAYQDISREISAVLPSPNEVVDLDGTNEAILVLTNDGKLTAYLTNSALKITGKVPLEISESLKEIKVINLPNEKLLIAAINKKGNQLCLYQIKQSIARPNPLEIITCNSSNANISYSGLDYDVNQSLISVGDSSRAIFFALNFT